MSRIAKNPVAIPSDVEVNLNGQAIAIKGSKGTLNWNVHPTVAVAIDDTDGAKVITFRARDGGQIARANSGTTRALVNNMVMGVSTGFERQLELVGVGYRVQAKGNTVNLTLGFSHPVEYQLPEGVKAETPNQTTLILKSIDKQKVGQVAAEIRDFRPPEPYKGKGIRYAGERIIRKETKKK